MKCPKCGSKNTIPIVYGTPPFRGKTQQRLENRELYLGGIRAPDIKSKYHCLNCGADFGTPPILVNKAGKEDYRDNVIEIEFQTGNTRGPDTQEVTIKKDNGKIILEVRFFQIVQMGRKFPHDYRREMSESEWNKLLDRLYGRLHLHEWEDEYTKPVGDSIIMDGDYWNLDLKLKSGQMRNYGGDPSYHPFWMEIKRTFMPFFKAED